jgi:hypothetical protein
MRRRIAVEQIAMKAGCIVRLSNAAAKSNKDLMARWRVLSIDGDTVHVEDRDDSEDLRTFNVNDLERISTGQLETKLVKAEELIPPVRHTHYSVEVFDDQADPYDDGEGTMNNGTDSLFDDPIQLQLDEDLDDEDAETDDEEDEDD